MNFTRLRPAFVAVAFALVTFSVACRDFGYPKEPLPGTGPVLSFASPRQGDDISLVHAVRVDAEDPTGVGTVVLSCSGLRLFQWTSAPYEAAVDFGPCRKLDGGESQALTLSLEGSDRQGNSTGPDRDAGSVIDVTLNSSSPGLTVEVPERVRPGQPFDVRIFVTSDAGLQGLPTLREGNQVYAVTDQGGGLFVAQVPGRALGLAAFDGGTLNPDDRAALLEQQSRTVDLTVEARALNGNSARRELRVSISRFLWERAIPGNLTSLGQMPVASPAGLHLPLEHSGLAWRPGLLRQSDGTFQPFPSALATQGYFGAAIDPSGESLLVAFTRPLADGDAGSNLARLAPGASSLTGTPVGGTIGMYESRGNFMAQRSPRAVPAFGGYCEEYFGEDCGPQSRGFRCLISGAEVLIADGGFRGEARSIALAGNDGGIFGFSVSGPTPYLFCPTLNTCDGVATDCAAVASVGRLSGPTLETPFADAGRLDPSSMNGARLYSVGQGRFALHFLQGQEPRLELVDVNASPSQTRPYYLFPADRSGVQPEQFLPIEQVAAILPSAEVLTAEPSGQQTLFRVRGLASTQSTLWDTLPGSYVGMSLNNSGSEPVELAQPSIVRGKDVYVLLFINSTTPAVLALSDQGAKWIWRYGRATRDAELYGGATGPLYLVDRENNLVVALSE